MSNEKFKVKFGLAVGDTTATIDAATGNIVTAGDLAVNGGDITTTSTGTANLFNTGAPDTINIGNSAVTEVNLGGTTTGRVQIKPNTIVGAQTTQNVFNTVATTVNAFGAATTTNIGNAGGPAGSAVPGAVNLAGNEFIANNYVKGAIRDSTTALNGDAWSFSNGTGGRARGLTIDNSIDTTKRPTAVLRAYGGGLAGGNPVAPFMGETARGSAASPTGLLAGNALVNFFAGGYADTSVGGANPGWVSDTTGNVPASMSFGTQEDWTSGTSNLGTRFRVNLAPTSSGVTTQVTMELTPQTSAFRSDAFTWSQGKSGTTQTLALDVNGNLTTTGNVRVNGNNILASDGNTNITLTSNTLTTLAGDLRLNGNDIQASDGNIAETLVPITGYNPNVDFVGNIVKGAIRTGAGESTGDVYSFTGPSGQGTGISIDNTDKVADRTTLVMRNFGASLTSGSPRNTIIGEAARGTAASPSNLTSANSLIDILGTGYTSTGWLSDLVNAPSGIIRLYTSEAWSNGTNNVGTGFRVLLQPAATTLTTGGASLQNSFQVSPEISLFRTDQLTVSDKTNNRSYIYTTADDGSGKPSFAVQKTNATSGSEFPNINFQTQRSSGGTYTPTQIYDFLGEFKWNGNALSGASPGGTTGPGASMAANATETWTTTAQGTQLNFSSIKAGTTTRYTTIAASPDNLTLSSTSINFKNFDSSAGIIGNNITYNRVYGQWQYDATVTPAASNTAYAYPIAGASGVTDFANIASVGSTSHIIPGALGMYKLQFSLQLENTDSGSEHTAYLWWRLNGVDVPASMGRVGIPKGTSTIAGWDNMIEVTNTSDYWEFMYAVDDATHVSLPYYGATAFGPSTASLFLTLVPIGA